MTPVLDSPHDESPRFHWSGGRRMQRLVRGVHKFQQEVVGKKADFLADLAKGQRPHTLSQPHSFTTLPSI
jgi:hypothetical protein